MQTDQMNSNELRDLRAIFVSEGFELWFVGGCVRDFLCGIPAKDVDLCTDATPDEQMAIYRKNDIRFVPTGLQHGTITAILKDDRYEITTLRTETDHTGRHATVAYTRDLTEDLSRRDLTINAIAMDFDGNVIDPFGGRDDLKNLRVRFVGDAEERMREDYLRILRFFRFHARVAGPRPLDADAVAAIRKTRAGLSQISSERIWMEMAKIITGPTPATILSEMRDLTIFEIIGMPHGFVGAPLHAQMRGVTDPASVMGWYVTDNDLIDGNVIDDLATLWKWSSAERERANFICKNSAVRDMEALRDLLVDQTPTEWVVDLAKLNDMDWRSLAEWSVPKMPVQGRDLIAAGVAPGREMGSILRQMESRWKASRFTLTKDDLLASLVKQMEATND